MHATLPARYRLFSLPLFILALLLFGGRTPNASAGTLSIEYYQDGEEPGTVWVLVTMDPIDPAPCDMSCPHPDFSELHVSPAPLHSAPWSETQWVWGWSYPGGYVNFDETGAIVSGDGWSRILVLDRETSYTLSGAMTRRSSMGQILRHDGSMECAPDEPGCDHYVYDYPEKQFVPQAVGARESSFSTMKAGYR